MKVLKKLLLRSSLSRVWGNAPRSSPSPSHHWREEAADVLEEGNDGIGFPCFFGNLGTLGLGGEEILLDFCQRVCSVETGSALKVHIKTAEIHVHSPDRTEGIVHHKIFGMNEALRVLENPNARVEQFPIVGTRGEVDKLFVGLVRRDDAHVDPTFGGKLFAAAIRWR